MGAVAAANWVQTGPTPHYATNSEAKDAFKQLLMDAGISSGMSWDESMRLIVQDRRWVFERGLEWDGEAEV